MIANLPNRRCATNTLCKRLWPQHVSRFPQCSRCCTRPTTNNGRNFRFARQLSFKSPDTGKYTVSPRRLTVSKNQDDNHKKICLLESKRTDIVRVQRGYGDDRLTRNSRLHQTVLGRRNMMKRSRTIEQRANFRLMWYSAVLRFFFSLKYEFSAGILFRWPLRNTSTVGDLLERSVPPTTKGKTYRLRIW